MLIIDGTSAKVANRLLKRLRKAKKTKRKGDDGYFAPPETKSGE